MDAIKDNYCSQCICHETGVRHPSMTGGTTLGTPTWGSSSWGSPTWGSGTTGGNGTTCINNVLGDTYCDDENNIEACNYDEGKMRSNLNNLV